MHLAFGYVAAADPGGYVSLVKLIPVLAILFIWARLMTWVDKDAVAAHLPREMLNTVLFGGGLLGFALFFLLPGFGLALAVLAIVHLATFGTYLAMRHSKVGLRDLKNEFNNFIRGMGKSEKVKEAKPGEIQFFSRGQALEVPSAEDPERAGYETAQEILTEPLKKNAEKLEVRPADAAAAVTYVVDGMPYNAPTLMKDRAAAAITYLKSAAGLDTDDRRKPQSGTVKFNLDGRKRELEVATAGSTAGESMRILVDPKKHTALTLDQLGMPEEQLQQLRDVIEDRSGIVLVTAPRGQGLTTMLYSLMRAHDAFVHHLQTVEHAPKEDMEGITQNKLSAQASPAEEAKQVDWVASQQPDVMMVDEMVNPASARTIIKFVAADHRRVYIGMRAGNGFEALSQWRKLVGDDRLAAEQLKFVLAGRVVRKLCMACKVGFAPDPETLRKYNMNPAKVTQLFQARSQPLRDPKGRPIPCEFCHDLRFRGRFGVYESMMIDDAMKQAIAAGASVQQLQNVFRKQKGRYLQESALLSVESGDTSVQEVIRVLKGGDQPARPAARTPVEQPQEM